jgi:membrane protein DedA with SNARE-associated domain
MSILLTSLQHFSSSLWSNQAHPLGNWIYFLIAILVTIQGPAVILLAGAASSAGWLNPGLVFAAAACGDLTADVFWYSLGHAGKVEWILRVGRRLGIRTDAVEYLQHAMREHAAKLLFLAKLTVGLVIPSLIAAGLVKADWKRWFPAVVGGETICTGTLVLLGYFAAAEVQRVQQTVEYIALGLTLAFILLMLWLGRRFLQKRLDQDRGLGKGSDDQ